VEATENLFVVVMIVRYRKSTENAWNITFIEFISQASFELGAQAFCLRSQRLFRSRTKAMAILGR
jgi:hypothetical protein